MSPGPARAGVQQRCGASGFHPSQEEREKEREPEIPGTRPCRQPPKDSADADSNPGAFYEESSGGTVAAPAHSEVFDEFFPPSPGSRPAMAQQDETSRFHGGRFSDAEDKRARNADDGTRVKAEPVGLPESQARQLRADSAGTVVIRNPCTLSPGPPRKSPAPGLTGFSRPRRPPVRVPSWRWWRNR